MITLGKLYGVDKGEFSHENETIKCDGQLSCSL